MRIKFDKIDGKNTHKFYDITGLKCQNHYYN